MHITANSYQYQRSVFFFITLLGNDDDHSLMLFFYTLLNAAEVFALQLPAGLKIRAFNLYLNSACLASDGKVHF